MHSKLDTSTGSMRTSLLKNVFSYDNLVHAVSGAAGSVVAMVVFYPLDTARTRLQIDDHRKAKHTPVVMAEIAKEEGVLSLYRGLIPVLTSLCCSNFVYFYTYNGLKAIFLGHTGKPDALKDLTFAFMAGVINVLVTTPLWVVNTRLKLQGIKFQTEKYREKKMPKYKGILDALLKIAKMEGIGTLWNGTLPAFALASNPSIQFMVYEMVKRYFQKLLVTKDLSGLLYFVIGAIAKATATIITYPLQVVQSRLRAGYNKEERSGSILSCLKELLRQQGAKGLYKGMEAKLLQTVLTAALMFMVYEKIAATIFRIMGYNQQQPSI
ncbi:peroxisomal membrane protein PMP34-like [Ylistrum balloti]|uniref:peroxisomal membrane protein PMP34-like n=1 Tax=Ylistrum balloti TaxID=509963 RepID=UPI002905F30A|nr:peroxisomal membrane protein PMP34-like [Ylistrum balloti]